MDAEHIHYKCNTTMQTYGRLESTVYLVYVETADADRREWGGDNEVDPIRENFDIFGQLTT